ncbi:MAG: hypothetical protein NVSMB23_07790 [Myxococcales bacterium]
MRNEAEVTGNAVLPRVRIGELEVDRLTFKGALDAIGFRVYLLGAGPGVAEKAAARLRVRPGVNIVGVEAPMLRDPTSAAERPPIVERIRRASPDLVLVAFGAPKQERFIHAAREELGSAVALGLGASLRILWRSLRERRLPAAPPSAGLRDARA